MSYSPVIKHLVVIVTTFCVLFGPVGLRSTSTLDDDPCAKKCASKSQTEVAAAQQQTKNDLEIQSNRCGDDCEDCNCNSGLSPAITPTAFRLASARRSPQIPTAHPSLTPRTSTDIFVPPIS